ncbi:hypothetical protein NJBCHELONAE_13710 [Mycobacteroides chelonae]|nr:hypothetical protein NJBCHELONAE_13710 [Mycobacteroides chelonae]
MRFPGGGRHHQDGRIARIGHTGDDEWAGTRRCRQIKAGLGGKGRGKNIECGIPQGCPDHPGERRGSHSHGAFILRRPDLEKIGPITVKATSRNSAWGRHRRTVDA